MKSGIENCKILDEGMIALEKRDKAKAEKLLKVCGDCNCMIKADLEELIGNKKEAQVIRGCEKYRINREYQELTRELFNPVKTSKYSG